jgi:SAM-dependent methyltransferase
MSEFNYDGMLYEKSRPIYPKQLYEWIASIAVNHDLVWDCGCGNGQAALGLAQYFQRVIATDSSQNQIDHSNQHPQVQYYCCSAEDPVDIVKGFDAVCCACAIHWFDLNRFYDCVRKRANKSSVIVVWTYEWPWTTSNALNDVLKEIKDNVLFGYWPSESNLYLNHYEELYFPFHEIESPQFYSELTTNPGGLSAFLHTWSPVRRYIKANGNQSNTLIEDMISKAWKIEEPKTPIQLPLYIKAGRI